MAQRRHYQPPRRKFTPRPSTAVPVEPPKPYVKAVPIQYGKPFILMEDEQKKTFEYQGGAWVSYSRSIAECKLDCQVKVLAQKVNKMTRYEIRSPVTA